MKLAVSLGAVSAVMMSLSLAPARAQQIEGVPGSPDATTTIDGRYLPNPPLAFGGTIGLSAKDSKP